MIDYCIAVGVHVYDMGSKKVNSLVAVEVGITDHVDKGRINGDAVFQISSLQPWEFLSVCVCVCVCVCERKRKDYHELMFEVYTVWGEVSYTHEWSGQEVEDNHIQHGCLLTFFSNILFIGPLQ